MTTVAGRRSGSRGAWRARSGALRHAAGPRGAAFVNGAPNWVGAHGYRYGNHPFAQMYVWHRVYALQTSQWTTRDLLWPEERAYGYVNGNPVLVVDSAGLQGGTGGILNDATRCRTIKRGPCPHAELLRQLSEGCVRSGTRLCYSKELPKTDLPVDCRYGCCGECFTRCESIRALGGIICTAMHGKALEQCAYTAIKRHLNRFENQVVPGKRPKVHESKNCPLCTAPGKGHHFQWNCKEHPKLLKHSVITANCCPCYHNGHITLVCYSSKGCHGKMR